MLWGCFLAAGTEGLVIVEEKLNAPKYRDSLNGNPVQSIPNLRLGPIDKSVNVLEWPNHSLAQACHIKQKDLRQ